MAISTFLFICFGAVATAAPLNWAVVDNSMILPSELVHWQEHGRFGVFSIGTTATTVISPGVEFLWPFDDGSLELPSYPWVLHTHRVRMPGALAIANQLCATSTSPCKVVAHAASWAVLMGRPSPSVQDSEAIALLSRADLISVSPTPLRRPTPPSPSLMQRIRSFSAIDPVVAAAVELVSADRLKDTDTFLAAYHSRQSASSGAREAASWLEGRFTAYGFNMSAFQFNRSMSDVVIATLRGSESPEEIVVLGAHYDSRSVDRWDPSLRAPGADDNGSGTSLLIEIARIFALQKIKPKYTLQLCAFSGEEQGLLGSRAYAKSLRANNATIVAMFNADMIGWTIPGQRSTLGLVTRLATTWLVNAAEVIASAYVPELPIAHTDSCCSDQQSFYEQGYPAIAFFEDAEGASAYPHYHQSTDLPQYVNFDQVALIAKAVLANILTFVGH